MFKTNNSLFIYLSALYENQLHKENIALKKCSKGFKLFSQNEIASKLMLITDGITKCYYTEDNEKDFILEFLGKGEIIGEVELIQNILSLCTVEAITEVSYFSINKAYFNELLKTDITLNNLLLESCTARIINTSMRVSFLQSYTIEHSLNKLLALQAKQNIELSKDEMAAYLGITIRSLNRVIKTINSSNN